MQHTYDYHPGDAAMRGDETVYATVSGSGGRYAIYLRYASTLDGISGKYSSNIPTHARAKEIIAIQGWTHVRNWAQARQMEAQK